MPAHWKHCRNALMTPDVRAETAVCMFSCLCAGNNRDPGHKNILRHASRESHDTWHNCSLVQQSRFCWLDCSGERSLWQNFTQTVKTKWWHVAPEMSKVDFTSSWSAKTLYWSLFNTVTLGDRSRLWPYVTFGWVHSHLKTANCKDLEHFNQFWQNNS